MGKTLLLTIFALMLTASFAGAAEVETRDFQVFRGGEPIGHHRVKILRDGERTTVSVDIKLRVTALGVLTLYRYLHDAEEIWEGQRLVSLSSTTDNDGTAERLEARAVAGGLQVSGTRFTGLLPADTMPSSYWHRDFVRRDTIMDSQNGRRLDLTIRPQSFEMASAAGSDIPAQRYQVSGDVDLTLWYDRAGRWVKSAFKGMDGSQIEYRLQ